MTMRHAEVNGIKIAFDIRGSGPSLVLIMGYRLNSHAMPAVPPGVHLHIIESARRASVVPDHEVISVQGSRALLYVNPAAWRILAGILREIPITLLDRS